MAPKPTHLLEFLLALLCLHHFNQLSFFCSGVHNLSAARSCHQLERQALLKFKEGLQDPSSILASWVGQDCCSWHGVVCENITGNVVRLDLQYRYWTTIQTQQLGGEIHPSLLNLKHLHYLDLSNNYFEGISIPPFMGSFKELRYLKLPSAGFNGSIPHQLGNLSSLQYLDLSYNLGLHLDDCRWLSNLTSLQYLDMNQVTFVSSTSNWLHTLNMLPSLTNLYLSNCFLPEIPLSLTHVNFTSLSVLDLSGNSIYSLLPVWLFKLTRLRHLNLASNNFYGPIHTALGNNTSLKVLDLSFNHEIEGMIPETLSRLSRLEILDLTFCSISQFGKNSSQRLPSSIAALHLSNNALSGYMPDWIGGLQNLKILDISYNSLNGPLPRSLGRLSSLQQLRLARNNLNGTIPQTLGQLKNLIVLDLSYNSLNGPLPACLGKLSLLQQLYLEGNKLNGTIPQSLGQLTNLINLYLGGNSLSGTIPQSLGQLKNLIDLDLSYNSLEGMLTETHFAKLTSLTSISLSGNPLLSLEVSSDWLPPFRLEYADMSSCLVGPRFPTWLQTQDALYHLNLSNAGISDTLPDWLWNISHQTWPEMEIDLSHNAIRGEIPHSLKPVGISFIDLSSNLLSGAIPFSIGEQMPSLNSLSLSTNNLDGAIPSSICQMNILFFLDLSSNQLSGKLPNCWTNISSLTYLHLENNNLSGGIPDFNLPWLHKLHLRNNSLSGELPLSLRNCEALGTLDIGHNEFTGKIPAWLGESLSNLTILSLRANMLVGEIPPQLTSLRALQILDLSSNNLSGAIPHSFGNFSAMKVTHNLTQLNYSSDYMYLDMKGREDSYKNDLLSLVTLIDLSDNGLSGGIPEELATLRGLQSLNLSGNHLGGVITDKLGDLQQLESLDLSRNKLSGVIPSTLTSLRFLSHLNLSHNNLSGRIPAGNQFNTFTDQSIYTGNQDLCGFPLNTTCQRDTATSPSPAIDEDEMLWLYLSLAPGFAVGFWAFWGVLACRKRWRVAYFQFIDEMWDKVYAITVIYSARLKKRMFRDN